MKSQMLCSPLFTLHSLLQEKKVGERKTAKAVQTLELNLL